MAKQKKPTEAVAMTAPSGAKVTVSKDSVDTYKARGYKAVSSSKSTEK